MIDLYELSHTIRAAPEWAQLLICISAFALCACFGWKAFARSSSDEPTTGRDPPRYVETEKAAANGPLEKVVDTQTVVEESLLDGGKVDGGSNDADGTNGLEEVVVAAAAMVPQGTRGKRTRRRG